MAMAALGHELRCSICLNLYTEPVSLRCGHNFCCACIVTALDTQEESGVYSCPECREEHTERPVMEKNRKLCNIVDNFRSTQQKEKHEILCTYCVDSPVVAVKTCLHCETSMCDKHLTAHNKTVDHVLMEPTSSFCSKLCSIHKELLDYYRSEDATCLCVSCCLVGKHKAYEVELLREALEKMKMRDVLEKMTTKRETIEKKIQVLQDQKRKELVKAEGKKKKVTALFEDMRSQLEVQEQKVLSEITRQVEKISWTHTSVLKQLEIQKVELSRKIDHIEKLSNTTDPRTVLQDDKSDTGDQNVEESSARLLDDFMISLVLHKSLTDLITNMQLKTSFRQERRDLLLDIKTAHNFVALSNDLRTASDTKTENIRPELPQRFTFYNQVMSRESFSHGRYYWEVEVGDCGDWDVGVCYPSIERNRDESGIGYNNKSWGFCTNENEYLCVHNSMKQLVHPESPVQRLGVYLDYEGGRLSYYQLSDPIRHLLTFPTTFTEPLHAVYHLNNGAWVKLISSVFFINP